MGGGVDSRERGGRVKGKEIKQWFVLGYSTISQCRFKLLTYQFLYLFISGINP